MNHHAISGQLLLFPDLPITTEGDKARGFKGEKKYSRFVVYVDESGDHGMQSLDSQYPILVLALCIFHKNHYSEKVVPALHKFKFNHFGHDLVVLHEHEIRKEKGAFRFFQSRQHKDNFLADLTSIIDLSNFILISCVIDKSKLRKHHHFGRNPYYIALGFCLETLYEFLQEKGQGSAVTHVVVECRGPKEDKDLDLEFRRVCGGANQLGITFPFDLIFADKKVDSPGLQFADLVARPIGLNVMRPGQKNRAFEILKRKFYCSGGRRQIGVGYHDWGLKIFPNA